MVLKLKEAEKMKAIRRNKSSVSIILIYVITLPACHSVVVDKILNNKEHATFFNHQMIAREVSTPASINSTSESMSSSVADNRASRDIEGATGSSRGDLHDARQQVHTVSINITAMPEILSLTYNGEDQRSKQNTSKTITGREEEEEEVEEVGGLDKSGNSESPDSTTIQLPSTTTSTTSTTTTTSTTSKPAISSRSRWFLSQMRKRRKLRAAKEQALNETALTDRLANLTASASQNHEDWVNFEPRGSLMSIPVAGEANIAPTLTKRREADDDSESQNDEKALVSKSTTTTTTIGDGKKQAKLINKGASLPAGLKRKIIEQFVKSGGNPNNIVVSDSTITTTSQSKKKTVTTVYKLEPTSGEIKPNNKPLMRAIKVSQMPVSNQAKMPKFTSDRGSLNSLLGNPKQSKKGMNRPAHKVKKIMVTRTEVPAVMVDEHERKFEKPELGEFYQGPHEAMMGIHDRGNKFSVSEKKAIMNLDKMIELSPDKPSELAELAPKKVRRPVSFGSMTMPKGVGGGGISIDNLLDMMGLKSSKGVNHLSNFNEIGGVPSKKGSEAGRTVAKTSPKPSENKVTGETKAPRSTSRPEAPKKSDRLSEPKEDSLAELKRAAFGVSSKRLKTINDPPAGSTSTSTTSTSTTSRPATRNQVEPRLASAKTKKVYEKRPVETPAKPAPRLSPAPIPSTTTTTSTSTTTSTTTTSTTPAPSSSKPKTHNIMMLFDFGPTPASTRLDKAASWQPAGDQWRPLSPLRAAPESEPEADEERPRRAQQVPERQLLQPLPAVNVQIYNGPRGSAMNNEYNLDEFGGLDGSPSSGPPSEYAGFEGSDMYDEGAAASPPLNFRPAPNPQGRRAQELVRPLELEQTLVPGESASTNQLVRAVINELAMSRDPLEVSASSQDKEAQEGEEPAYYTSTSVHNSPSEALEAEREELLAGSLLGADVGPVSAGAPERSQLGGGAEDESAPTPTSSSSAFQSAPDQDHDGASSGVA